MKIVNILDWIENEAVREEEIQLSLTFLVQKIRKSRILFTTKRLILQNEKRQLHI